MSRLVATLLLPSRAYSDGCVGGSYCFSYESMVGVQVMFACRSSSLHPKLKLYRYMSLTTSSHQVSQAIRAFRVDRQFRQ